MMRVVRSKDLLLPLPPDRDFISLTKPADVLRSYARPADLIVDALNAETEDLVRAHSLRHVKGVGQGVRPTGFGYVDTSVLKHVLAANGTMITAIREAVEHPEDVVCAPVSGFHHAGYDFSGGFCTFNGLIAGICAVRLTQALPKVLIIDGDAHYGNGTDDCIARLGLGGITNLTHKPQGPNSLSPKIWEMQIRGLLTNTAWDLIIYQAGADAHKEDPFKAGYLDDGEWDWRDLLIFQLTKRLKLPMVFNLAGGYNGVKTLQLHGRTMKTARMCYEGTHGLEDGPVGMRDENLAEGSAYQELMKRPLPAGVYGDRAPA